MKQPCRRRFSPSSFFFFNILFVFRYNPSYRVYTVTVHVTQIFFEVRSGQRLPRCHWEHPVAPHFFGSEQRRCQASPRTFGLKDPPLLISPLFAVFHFHSARAGSHSGSDASFVYLFFFFGQELNSQSVSDTVKLELSGSKTRRWSSASQTMIGFLLFFFFF